MGANEWLIELVSNPDAYKQLLDDSGSLAKAAHRLASAKCSVHEMSTNVPTMREVAAAAREIATKAGGSLTIPAPRSLASDCELEGLPVIGR